MMKKKLRNTCVVLLMTLCVLPAFGQMGKDKDGYYRVRNSQNPTHYIGLANDKFSYQTLVGSASSAWSNKEARITYAAAFLRNDVHVLEENEEVISPATLIYVMGRVNSDSNTEYNLIAQGTSFRTLATGNYTGNSILVGRQNFDKWLIIQKVSGSSDLFTAMIELSTTSGISLGTRYFRDSIMVNGNPIFSVCENNNIGEARWKIEPITYFNVTPELEYNGKYYTTLKVPFKWQIDNGSSVEKVFVITGVNADGELQYTPLTGTITEGTAVLLECSSNDPIDCKLKPLGIPKFPAASTDYQSAPPALEDDYYVTAGGTNLLKGTYFCNTDGRIPYKASNSANTYTAYTSNNFTSPSNLFELGTTGEKLGFVTAQGVTMPTYSFNTSTGEPTANGTIKAMPANKAWMEHEGSFHIIRAVATPTLSPEAGTYHESQTVTITAEQGATIEYSIDGGNTWQTYTGAISVDETMAIQARAFIPGLQDNSAGVYAPSEVAAASYTIQELNPVLAMTPESMTISDAAAGVFTITGTDIQGSINVGLANNTDWYLNPETLSNTGGEVNVTYTGRALTAQNTVNAYAANNAEVTASATVNYKADIYVVTDNGVEGNWNFNNGSMMTEEDGIYTATFTATVPNTFILFARKLGDGVSWNSRYVFGPNSDDDWWMPADVAEQGGTIDVDDDDPIKLPYAGEYTITINANDYTFNIARKVETVATPTFTPAAGTYTGTQTVTIACETEGATISYKINDGEYQAYNGPIEVTETCTITAKATKDGWNASEEAVAEYVIEIPVVHTIGDVNHDGKVNIKDVTVLIDYLLDNTTEVCSTCADVKSDGSINIGDVTSLIDMLLQNPQDQ